MGAEPPIVAVVVNSELASPGVFAFPQLLEKPLRDVNWANVLQHAVGNDVLFHVFLVLGIQSNFQVDFAHPQLNLDGNP